MLKIIYIVCIILITIWTIYIYIDQSRQHKNELNRIRLLEDNIKRRKDFINKNRFNSIPCPIQGLTNPRDCYINSGYTCRWSEVADRCNEI